MTGLDFAPTILVKMTMLWLSEGKTMTDGYDDKYDGLCPDNQHETFERKVQIIAATASKIEGERQSKKPPSKVKRDLEQLRNSLHKLSPDALSSLSDMEDSEFLHSPIPELVMDIELALSRLRNGRPTKDEVRYYLGIRAANLWWRHNGDIEAVEFVEFLGYLIEETGFVDKDGTKSRIDSSNLARDVRKIFENYNPPRWEKSRFFTTPNPN
jgi:hypothetical protein